MCKLYDRNQEDLTNAFELGIFVTFTVFDVVIIFKVWASLAMTKELIRGRKKKNYQLFWINVLLIATNITMYRFELSKTN